MPFVAVCPYCNTGRVRVPENALGLTAPCPNCKTSFTLIDSGLSDSPEPVPAFLRPATVTETATAAVAPTASAPVFRAPNMSVQVGSMMADDDDDKQWGTTDALRVPTILAFCFAGVGLIASQIPYGRIATVVFTAIGLVTALAAWYGSRRPVLPISAAGLNAVVLLIVSLLPTWLGIDSWRPPPEIKERQTPLAFNKDGLQPTTEWTDVSNAWQFDDVRVRVIVTNEQIELTGPKDQKRWSKPSYLRVRVAVRNVGVARQIDVIDWDAKTPMKLTDAMGKVIAPATFEGDWLPTLRRKHKSITPGEGVEHDYLFEEPVNAGGFLRLELPGGPCGAAEQTIRFQIPTRPLGLRTSQG